ncbi:MAG: glycosyl hydrolase family 5 [Devosia sp.]|nr:glycosyl hydrolase family 5 [Devosia sp.]
MLAVFCSGSARAATIANPVATFSGLDKVTARVTTFDVYIDETVQFGALQITPRACYTRPTTEVQRTSVFIEVDQVSLKGTMTRIFTGWMFADSPALNAIDHPVYDIWLVDCKQSSGVTPPALRGPITPDAAAAPTN